MLTPCGLLILSPADLNGKRLLRSFRNLPCDGYDLLAFWNETQQKQARAFYGTARKGCPAVAGEHKCRQGMLSGACVHSAECTKLRNASDREYRFRLLNFPPYLYFSEAEPALSRLCLIFSPLRLSFRPPLCLTLLSLRLPLSLRLLCRSHAVFSRSSAVCLPFTHRSPRRLPVVSPAINRLACRSLCVSSAVHPLFVCRPLLFCLPHPAASSVAVLILLSVQKTYFRSVILPDGNLQTPLPESRQKMPQRAKNVCALRHSHLTDKKPRKNCGVFNYCAL